jgi:hypothetical protein
MTATGASETAAEPTAIAAKEPPRSAGVPPYLAVLASIAALLGLALRIIGFNRKSFWIDEVLTFDRMSSPTLEALMQGLRNSPFPPLYYLGANRQRIAQF